MNLSQLINYLNMHAANSFFLKGRYGYIQVTPESDYIGQRTYTVDGAYSQLNTTSYMHHQQGFRLSTIGCLCACVLYGEAVLDDRMITAINNGCLSA